MKNLYLFLLIILGMIGAQSCQKDDMLPNNEQSSELDLALKSKTVNTFYSSTIPLGNGVARGWIKVNKDGDPMEVGINLSEKALMNLPDVPMQYVIELPKTKGNHFYTHALFDWNPQGHEPDGIYTLPHFDFHFYIISNEERMAIPPRDISYQDSIPPNQYIPENYVELPGLVPGMGAHWVDIYSPELPPTFAKFTHTMIWGSYQGEFIFWEPMITREYLMTQTNEVFAIAQPTAYQKDGWYATDYRISYSENPSEYSVALINLRHVEKN